MGIPMKAGGGHPRAHRRGRGDLPAAAARRQPAAPRRRQTPAPAPTQDAGDVASAQTELEQIVCGAVDDVSGLLDRRVPAGLRRPVPRRPTRCSSPARSNTGCGQASCPDRARSTARPTGWCTSTSTSSTQLQDQFGATGDLAAQYIVAHEYGHHVQNVLGVSSEVSRLQQQDPGHANAYSVALELQADCFAGAWANDAEARASSSRARSARRSTPPRPSATTASSSRPAGPSTRQFTHGTSEQRGVVVPPRLRHRRPPPVQHVPGARERDGAAQPPRRR